MSEKTLNMIAVLLFTCLILTMIGVTISLVMKTKIPNDHHPEEIIIIGEITNIKTKVFSYNEFITLETTNGDILKIYLPLKTNFYEGQTLELIFIKTNTTWWQYIKLNFSKGSVALTNTQVINDGWFEAVTIYKLNEINIIEELKND